ncbi:hypothetical protein [Paraburkholderia acidisoli]|uniref:Uncharacterized protein n=1 Tax=Paraburkholderia acidisoli TaxID=2571748 RepID=A0A7Z2GIL8_9BURK|nr:hypothetical protein [Paraburkholderia acidisoli]QGZ62119.1 hypothetical protein FAZ98_10470 [Paraburkholderia acidisoli]
MSTMIMWVGLAQQPVTLLNGVESVVQAAPYVARSSGTTINLFATTTHAPSENTAADIPPVLTKIEALRAEINDYAGLADGWDGEGSRAPSADAVVDAICLTMHLPAGIPVPRAMVSANGEVGLYWRSDRAYVDIAIEDGGTISIYARDKANGDQEQFWDELPASKVTTADLSNYLAILAA